MLKIPIFAAKLFEEYGDNYSRRNKKADRRRSEVK